MSRKAHGQLRRSQIITTWGPGSLLDLPKDSVIVGGLDTWPRISDLEEITEQRLAAKLRQITGVPAPDLYAPPADDNDPREGQEGYRRLAVPGVVRRTGSQLDRRMKTNGQDDLVHRKALEGGKV